MTRLVLADLTVRRGDCPVVDHVSLAVGAGEVVGLIGPNGAGKTTLMRAALGLIAASGTSSLLALSPAVRARAVAWLPQGRDIAWPMPVAAVVGLGRLPHGDDATVTGRAAVAEALARMDLTGFADRPATALSGGEQARVLIARALAQQAPLLLADEPLAGLDPAHQIATLQVFRDLAAAGGSVMVSLHDLGLAARHCTRLVLLDRGRLIADGAPRDVLTPARLAAVFGITAHLSDGPGGVIFQPLEVVA
jgi:iron complex transport system ATP-binding protein